MFTTTHYIADEDDKMDLEVEDLGANKIRLHIAGERTTMGTELTGVSLTLGIAQATKLARVIDTYFQDQDMRGGKK